MLIVEGSDGAGKSTLVRRLSSDLRLQIGQRATSDRSELYKVTRQDTYTALGGSVGGAEPVKIWDRLFYSEMVYAPAVGRPCEFSGGEQVFIGRVIQAMVCPVIYCNPPLEVVRMNIAKADQMKGVHENIEDIYEAYKRVFRSAGYPPYLFPYDYTRPDADKQYSTIMEAAQNYMKHKRERSW